jgi:hypothetical protein
LAAAGMAGFNGLDVFLVGCPPAGSDGVDSFCMMQTCIELGHCPVNTCPNLFVQVNTQFTRTLIIILVSDSMALPCCNPFNQKRKTINVSSVENY